MLPVTICECLMKLPPIPVYEPYRAPHAKRYVDDCMDTNWISSKGKYLALFEEKCAEYLGVERAAAVSNGTVALHLALLALGIGPGDEVIVPSLTYVASANAIAYVGATPVFVDSKIETLQMDPLDVARKITPKTRAILAVHLYGHPCELDALQKLCCERGLFLVEDCAEAFGSFYRGVHVGTQCDVSTFSFFGNKTLTTGEGGLVICRNRELDQKVRLLRSQGTPVEGRYWHSVVGYNYRMTHLAAAIGVAGLEVIEEILEKKRAIAAFYERNIPLRFHQAVGPVVHSYWMCSVLLDKREALRAFLSERGIETRPFFHPVHQLPMYAKGEQLPQAEALSAQGVNLPSFPALTEEQLCRICDAIEEFTCCTSMDVGGMRAVQPTSI